MAPTIFHGLLSTANLPESEKATPRLVDEARILLAAGTDTTANTLAAITYHLLANPEILKRLKDELASAIPHPESTPELYQIEGLPYLTAAIQEGIRLHPGVSFRQDRVAPDEDLFYEDVNSGKKYIIPRGVCDSSCKGWLLTVKDPSWHDSPSLEQEWRALSISNDIKSRSISSESKTCPISTQFFKRIPKMPWRKLPRFCDLRILTDADKSCVC